MVGAVARMTFFYSAEWVIRIWIRNAVTTIFSTLHHLCLSAIWQGDYCSDSMFHDAIETNMHTQNIINAAVNFSSHIGNCIIPQNRTAVPINAIMSLMIVSMILYFEIVCKVIQSAKAQAML